MTGDMHGVQAAAAAAARDHLGRGIAVRVDRGARRHRVAPRPPGPVAPPLHEDRVTARLHVVDQRGRIDRPAGVADSSTVAGADAPAVPCCHRCRRLPERQPLRRGPRRSPGAGGE